MDSPNSKPHPADRLKKLTRAYEKRLAAERMQEIPRTSTALAHEGFDEALKRIDKLERILQRISYEASRIPECGSIRAILEEVNDAGTQG